MTRFIRFVPCWAGLGLWCAVLGGCAGGTAPAETPAHRHEHHHEHRHEHGRGHQHPAQAPASAAAAPLERVAAIHGGAGPWVVAGYRMGAFALAKLGLQQGSFDLEIVHHSPKEVQYSCVADGAAAATGASLGKLNLSLADADRADVRTTYRRKSTGQAVTLRPSKAFVDRYKDVPRERLAEAGREVLTLAEDQVFDVVP